LALLICAVVHIVVIACYNFANAKFTGDAEGETSDYGAGAEICELIGVVSHTILLSLAIGEREIKIPFLGTVVAIDERAIGLPLIGGLVLEF